jgi:squalene-associated FAD-dependent desaturase
VGTDRLCSFDTGLSLHYFDTKKGHARLSLPRLLPSPIDLLVGISRFRMLTWSDRLDVIRFGLRVRRLEAGKDETVETFLRRLGQSQNTCRRLWYPLVLAALNTVPEQASARLFVEVIRLAVLPGGRQTGLVTPRVGLSHLLEPAIDYIRERGGEVIAGRPIQEVRRVSADGASRWVLNPGRTSEIESNALLAALPASSFADLFSSHAPDVASRAAAITHNPILSLYIWFDRPVDDVPALAALFGTTVEWVANRGVITVRDAESEAGLLECIISAADRVSTISDNDLVDIALKDLVKMAPAIERANVIDTQVIREKRATFASTPEVDRVRPLPGHVGDRLYVAGDWTQTSLPGTIEGAARSGNRAAETLIADSGIIERDNSDMAHMRIVDSGSKREP